MMETSSPLAAMRAPGLSQSPWSFNSDMTRGSTSSECSLFSRPNLNLSGRADSYFDMDMSMASSPTSCLAADLSQNFHIDKSPAFPTPRRSLFTAWDEHRKAVVTTPPLPPSSPAPCYDAMDMSPLPHKAPFTMTTSLPTKMNEMLSSPCASLQVQDSPLEHIKRPIAERKKSIHLRRPSLARCSRNLSTTMINKSIGNNTNTIGKDGPSFTFGQQKNSQPMMDLDEMFGPSPVNEKRVGLGIAEDAFSKPRQPLFGGISQDGSPMSATVRRPFPRPQRKVCRRAVSMFTKPTDVFKSDVKDEELICAQSPSQVAARECQILPCQNGPSGEPMKRITKETLVDVIDGKYKHLYDEHVIVDCRFEYEYSGGHIDGAINVNTTDICDETFLKTPRSQRTLLIFHCEFSAHRAPKMAAHLRKLDRQVNMHRYPELFYPEVYILDRGYSNFFETYRLRCEPQNYINMLNADHKQTCEREMGKFRKNTKFSRAQSYTFGASLKQQFQQKQQQQDDSPLQRKPLISCPVNEPIRSYSAMATLKPAFGRAKSDPRRMASY